MSKTEYDSMIQRANASSSSSTATHVTLGNTYLHSSSRNTPWILDSGASDHMTGDLSLLNDVVKTYVTIADGTKIRVQGIGTYRSSGLVFQSVLYLPQFPFNLLSIHKLSHTHQCSILFSPSHCEFQDLQTKRMIGGGYEKNGLYYLQEQQQQQSSSHSALHSTVTPYQWHCRLGHPSSANLRHVS
ncbi:hypothetical protein Vadar_026123 [Vaccinium darrowii]|uniref:Uncharacterized protein n=1 Tax=Vaccinium darrowii TaxID=229202 RepID=A0ACB7XUP4_9ERIC|nr:hypothetical protein Vadar_026123 [Vaccinium darrowii]